MLKRTTDPLRLTWKGEQSFSPFGEILKVDIGVQNVILPSLTFYAPNAAESTSSRSRTTIAHPNFSVEISKMWTLINFTVERNFRRDFIGILRSFGRHPIKRVSFGGKRNWFCRFKTLWYHFWELRNLPVPDPNASHCHSTQDLPIEKPEFLGSEETSTTFAILYTQYLVPQFYFLIIFKFTWPKLRWRLDRLKSAILSHEICKPCHKYVQNPPFKMRPNFNKFWYLEPTRNKIALWSWANSGP